jgi:hypothetical protein
MADATFSGEDCWNLGVNQAGSDCAGDFFHTFGLNSLDTGGPEFKSANFGRGVAEHKLIQMIGRLES